ncbi:cytochrome c biogenesis protein CcsA [Myxococcota bacterium]|nr:cytochrome c biogenesis protein CcsA [Myxococcota bacterium]
MSELGALSLRFALVLAIFGIGTGIYAGISRNPQWTRVAERCLLVVAAFVGFSIAQLFYALATFDFQLVYVAQHSARSMSLAYRLAALWGGQAGSLLLWLFVLCLYSAVCVWTQRDRNRSLMPWVVAILLANSVFFLVLLCFVSDPFERLPAGHVLSDGNGLNPLLQHPVMMIHPLVLYAGLVGFAVPFAFAFAALMTGELGTNWFRTTRRSTLFAWFCLGVGILLGGRWAYEVLGWGGYWAWDPVENASFMPWLTATAYLHSVMIQEKRNMLRTWNLLLIGLTYTLCLFGTFLTRSGIVQSVHAFAQTPLFTSIFLGYVIANAGVFLIAMLARRGELHSPQRMDSMVSREASFLLNNWVFIAILMVVFWGTLFPVFSEAITGNRIAIGPKFFNTMAGPLALLLLLLAGIGPLIAWRRASMESLRRQFILPGAAGIATSAVLVVWVGKAGFYAVTAWSLCAFVVASIVQEYARAIRARTRRGEENALQALWVLLRKNQARYGGYIVHLSIVFILMGTAGSALNEERLENVAPGSEVTLNRYQLRYLTAEAIPEQHYGGAVARLALYRDEEPLTVMTPEKRMYWLEQQPASIPSVYSTWREDLYVILTAIESDGSATLKIYRNPLVNWIWIGGVTFVLGSVLILLPDPRVGHRTSAPAA